jgi:hypothetical protein
MPGKTKCCQHCGKKVTMPSKGKGKRKAKSKKR